MSLSITITKDDVTPDLQAKAKAAANPSPIWRAAGQQVVSITKRSFREPDLRIASWKEKRDGNPSNLIAKGTLLSSIRVTQVTRDGVAVGSDRKYAAIHQLGGIIRAKPGGPPLTFMSGGRLWQVRKVKMPARPYWPFLPDGNLAPKHAPKVLAIMDKAAQQHLGFK